MWYQPVPQEQPKPRKEDSETKNSSLSSPSPGGGFWDRKIIPLSTKSTPAITSPVAKKSLCIADLTTGNWAAKP